MAENSGKTIKGLTAGNPTTRTTSPQGKPGIGLDLSPLVSLNKNIEQLDKKLTSFVDQMSKISTTNNNDNRQNNSIVDQISKMSDKIVSAIQRQSQPKFGERAPDINNDKNSGNVDFNREILASLRKQSQTTQIILEQIVPNLEEIKSAIVSSIETNKTGYENITQTNNETVVNEAGLTEDQISVFEQFNQPIRDITETLHIMVSTQQETINSLASLKSINNTASSIESIPITKDTFNATLDDTKMLDALNQIKMQLLANNQTTSIEQKTTPQLIQPEPKPIEYEGVRSSPLKNNDYDIINIDKYMPSKQQELNTNQNSIILNANRSAILGSSTVTLDNEPSYIKKYFNDVYETSDVGYVSKNETIPLLNLNEFNDYSFDDLQTQKTYKPKTFKFSDFLSTRMLPLKNENEDLIESNGDMNEENKVTKILKTSVWDLFKSKNKSKKQEENEAIDVDYEVAQNDIEEKNSLFDLNGEKNSFNLLKGSGKSENEGLFGNLISSKTSNDILKPGSSLAIAQSTGLGLLLIDLFRRQSESSGNTQSHLQQLVEASAMSGKGLNSLSSLMLEESKQKASDKALGNEELPLLNLGGRDLFGEAIKNMGSQISKGIPSNLSEGLSKGGLGIDLGNIAKLAPGALPAATPAAGGGSFLSTSIGGGVGSGLFMGALIGTAGVLATKLGVLAFRGEEDRQAMQAALDSKMQATTTAMQNLQRSKQYQVRLQNRMDSLNKSAEDRNAFDKLNLEIENDRGDRMHQRDYAAKIAKISEEDLRDKKMGDDDLAKMEEALRKQEGDNKIEMLKNINKSDEELRDLSDSVKAGSYDNEPYWLTQEEVNKGQSYTRSELEEVQRIVERKIRMAEQEIKDSWGPAIQAKRAKSNLTEYLQKLKEKLRHVIYRDKQNEELEKQRKKIEQIRQERAAAAAAEQQAAAAAQEGQKITEEGLVKKDVENTAPSELLEDIKNDVSSEEYQQLQNDLNSDNVEVRQAAIDRIKQLYNNHDFTVKPENAEAGLQQQEVQTTPQQQIAESNAQLSEQDEQERQRQAAVQAEQQRKEEAEIARAEQQSKDLKRLAENAEAQTIAVQKTAEHSDKEPVNVTQIVPPSNNLTTRPIHSVKV